MRGWNWGAFAISVIWAFCHRMPGWGAGILALNLASNIPVVGVFPGLAALGLSIYLGIKGNELAWQRRPFESLQQFHATERVWRTWGIVIFVIVIALVMIGTIASLVVELGGAAGGY